MVNGTAAAVASTTSRKSTAPDAVARRASDFHGSGAADLSRWLTSRSASRRRCISSPRLLSFACDSANSRGLSCETTAWLHAAAVASTPALSTRSESISETMPTAAAFSSSQEVSMCALSLGASSPAALE